MKHGQCIDVCNWMSPIASVLILLTRSAPLQRLAQWPPTLRLREQIRPEQKY